MKPANDLQQEQHDIWNGEKGETWVETEDFIDGMLRPFQDLIVEEVVRAAPASVLDVGCGNGPTTRAIKSALGEKVRCAGVDLSEPMTKNARERAARAGLDIDFICADASEYPFEGASFDVITSRFGVMFFADPVKAFSNLRSASAKDGSLALLVWGDPAKNEFMTTAHHAAVPLLPDTPDRDPTEPGQFSLANADHAYALLSKSGWGDIDFELTDVDCAFSAADLDMFIQKLAPMGYDVPSLDKNKQEEIFRVIRAAYEPFVYGDEVRFTGYTVIIRARST